MKVNLTKREAEYLRSAPFWDWKRVEIDIQFEEVWLGDNKKELKKVHKANARGEKFYRVLYEKLGGKVNKK